MGGSTQTPSDFLSDFLGNSPAVRRHVRQTRGSRTAASIGGARASFAPSLSVHRETPLVEAVCACLFADGDLHLDAWVPTSIDALERQGSRSRSEASTPKARALLAAGLSALDCRAGADHGRHFETLTREEQLLTLGMLESGRLTLSRAAGTAFLDCFMGLAAQAYLSVAYHRGQGELTDSASGAVALADHP